MSDSWSPNPVREPQFAIGQRVRVKTEPSKCIKRDVRDRYQSDEGEWFYMLDSRNYLHEAMLEATDDSRTATIPRS